VWHRLVVGKAFQGGLTQGKSSAMASILDKDELLEWNALSAVERVLPSAPKGGKPSEEVRHAISGFRTLRKAFLARLSDEKRAALTETKKPPQAQKKSKKEAVESEEERKQRFAALDQFAVRDPTTSSVCNLVDIGINIQSRFKKKEILAQLERSAATGTNRAILTGCSLKSSLEGIELCRSWYKAPSSEDQEAASKFPIGGLAKGTNVRLYATVGVHPHDAKTIASEEGVDATKMAEIRKLAESPFCVSLGECGLDYDRMFSPMKSQQHAFEAQVALAAELGRPLFVHLREVDTEKGPPLGAVEHAATILSKFPSLVPEKVCVHCFTGDKESLKLLCERGYRIGLTGFVGMNKRATSSGTLEALGADSPLKLDALMIETDSPFMRPDKSWIPKETGLLKGRENEPSVLPAVCRAVAQVFHGGKYTPEEIATVSTQNAISFFDLEKADAAIADSGQGF